MSTLRNTMTTAAALMLVASVAGAQETRRRESIPVDQLPPAGMCRVWIEGLVVSRQPAATDCDTARRNAPANSRIVYGGSSNGRVFLLPRTTDPRWDPRDPRNNRDGRELTKEERKRMKEWQKAQRKREKELEKIQRERNKEWEKSHRSDRRRDNDDRDDDRRNRTVDDRTPRDDGRFTQVPRIFRP